MNFIDQITVLILTLDEAPNIRRTLDALAGFSDILVIDSGSTDETIDIVKSYANTRVLIRAFDEHALQWNYGLESCGRAWVLALDADYVVSKSFTAAVSTLTPPAHVAGYSAKFRYCVNGRPLSGTLYPAAVVLFRREKARYFQDGHTQRLRLAGAIVCLQDPIDHDDRKPLARWLSSQVRYAKLEADHLTSLPRSDLHWVDRLRLNGWAAPIIVLLYTLIVKRCVLNGLPGWLYVMQRVLAELMLAIEIVDRRVRARQTLGENSRTVGRK